MKKIIDRLLKDAPGAESEYFEASDWFENASPAEIKKAIKTFEKHYERRLNELSALLGPPVSTDKSDRDAIQAWYPEAIRAACWVKDGKTMCLALEKQDQETPVSVLLRCVTAEEIAELAE
jgi:hypothetical protein